MKLVTVALDCGDPLEEEFKKLNIGPQEDEKDPIDELREKLTNVNINTNVEQLTERGKVKTEHNLKRNDPYRKNDFGRPRHDSVDSGNGSDVSANSPSPHSSECIFTTFDENTSTTKLVSLERWQDTTSSQKSSLVQCETNTTFARNKHIEALPRPDFVFKKYKEQRKSATISNNEEKILNLEKTHTVKNHTDDAIRETYKLQTAKEIFERQLNSEAMKKKWLELVVFPKEDIFSTDSEGSTIFHRLLNKQEDDYLPEALYTVMEEIKQHPSKCRDLLELKDTILESLKSFKGNTDLLQYYFGTSFIVLSLMYDY